MTVTYAQGKKELKENKKIQVLNIGMFHMGETSDETSTEYNEASKRAKKEIKQIVESISKFKPTIILVEVQPKYQQNLDKAYKKYLKDSNSDIGYYGKSETGLIGFAVGKLTGVKRIYGIDHRMSYNYLLDSLANKVNAKKYFRVKKSIYSSFKNEMYDPKKVGLRKSLLFFNLQESYDLFIAGNADMLTYINSKDKFEGADEAAKYYKRNLRMFGNINNITMTKKDRVLIISGASHAAFFNMFMKRSSIYELKTLKEYLK